MPCAGLLPLVDSPECGGLGDAGPVAVEGRYPLVGVKAGALVQPDVGAQGFVPGELIGGLVPQPADALDAQIQSLGGLPVAEALQLAQPGDVALVRLGYVED